MARECDEKAARNKLPRAVPADFREASTEQVYFFDFFLPEPVAEWDEAYAAPSSLASV